MACPAGEKCDRPEAGDNVQDRWESSEYLPGHAVAQAVLQHGNPNRCELTVRAGAQVSEAEYKSRVAGVTDRAHEDWIRLSDTCGFKEGDMIVPDHCASVPEAVASVAHNGTVFIRKGACAPATARTAPAMRRPPGRLTPAAGARRRVQVGRGAGRAEAHAHPRGAEPGRGSARRAGPPHARRTLAPRVCPRPPPARAACGRGARSDARARRRTGSERSSGSFKHVNCIARFNQPQGAAPPPGEAGG
jgi:hypothetical protein